MRNQRWLAVLLVMVQMMVMLPFTSASAAKAIKVACVGDSITQGIGVSNESTESYPAQLQALLGKDYEVGNFGVSKYAALKTALFPYWEHEKYQESLAFTPDIVVIMLGTNDIKTENWVEGKAHFVDDYCALIDSYKALKTNPKVFVVLPPPIFLPETDEVRPPNNLRNEALPLLREAAEKTGSYLIDVFSVFDKNPALLPDLIHPNAEGAALLAETIKDGILNPVPAKTPEPSPTPALSPLPNESEEPAASSKPTWSENLAAVPAFAEPAGSLTREEFAMLVVNIFGLESENATSKFEDISDCVYKDEIIVANTLGIVNGTDAAHFNPGGNITRQEITVMIYRAWRNVLFPDNDYTVANTYEFVDAEEISDWAVEAITYMYDNAIVRGTDILTISPLLNITREHGLLLMSRLVEKYSPEFE